MIDISSAFSDSHYDSPARFSVGLYGGKIDDRTRYSTEYVVKNCSNSFCFVYDADDLLVRVNGSCVQCHDLASYLEKLRIESVLLDATSLGVSELALLLAALPKLRPIRVLVFYVEPEDYESKNTDPNQIKEFSLSDKIYGFECPGIPTISKPFSGSQNRKFAFFIGYESSRLLSAFDAFDVESNEARVFVGLPAFQFGWESNSINANLRVLQDKSLAGRVSYCGASSVTRAIEELRLAYDLNFDDAIYVVPIGTKPNAIGALLYLNENENAHLLFDQPVKKLERSKGVGRRHYYQFSYE